MNKQLSIAFKIYRAWLEASNLSSDYNDYDETKNEIDSILTWGMDAAPLVEEDRANHRDYKEAADILLTCLDAVNGSVSDYSAYEWAEMIIMLSELSYDQTIDLGSAGGEVRIIHTDGIEEIHQDLVIDHIKSECEQDLPSWLDVDWVESANNYAQGDFATWFSVDGYERTIHNFHVFKTEG